MNRRDFLKAMGVSALAISQGSYASASARTASRKTQKPNLLIVFPDQMRGQAMGFLNEEPVITPNLDRFAAESLVLPQTISNYPVCSPFRAMLMSGKYPIANRVTSNCNSKSAPYNCQLQETDRCWSDVLKAQGYDLGYIGKWHLDSPHKPYVDTSNNKGAVAWNEWCPPNRRHGFDYWYAYGTYDKHTRPLYWDTESGRDDFQYVDQWGPEHEADKAIQYISNKGGRFRNPDKPFAMVVSMNPPHQPYKLVPQKYVDQYESKSSAELFGRPNIPPADTKMGKLYRDNIRYYYGMITGVDEQFGRILQALKQHRLEDNTIVVFTSDHGNCLGIHHEVSKNNHYEESMRVPFIIRWPGKIKARRDDLLFSSLDIYPTLLELTGNKKHIPQDIDGASHAKRFMTGTGQTPGWQWYMWCPYGNPELGRRGIRNKQYTFVITKAKEKPDVYHLYDNVNDPYQLKNIAEAQPELVQQLTGRLKAVFKKYRDPWLNS